MIKIDWQLIVTRETTVFERCLRVLGYYTMFGMRDTMNVRKVLVISHDNLTAQYFDGNEKIKRLKYIEEEYEKGRFNEFLTMWAGYPEKLNQAVAGLQKDFNKKNLKEFFKHYYYGRGIVIYAEELSKVIETKELAEDDIKKVGYWHEKAETVTSFAFDAVKKLIAAECEEKNIPAHDGLSYTPLEFLDLLENNKKIDSDVIKKRNTYYVLMMNEGALTIYLDDVAKKIEEEITGTLTDVTEISVVKGSVAFQGKVRGRVRIVNTEVQMKNIEEGEILVSIMTNPRLMPALIKASAVVTDEGGIICHAAIVARELRKPCIIGTKIATRVFKDGDMVEVDAINGIVKKL